MNEPIRPNPDALLAAIQREETSLQRAKLKIFLGMCAGVGKTYAMLQAGRQQLQEGVEILVALVETHGRTETEALLKNLQILPRKRLDYRGVVLEEMDLDAILEQRPQLVLVDELAHSNAPGSRHPKRYQDVLELLDAGINVYTTLNIQHLESRVDTVSQITGIRVQETVPDSILDRADEIQLIDLSPEQLRERLADGKVYLGERAATASENFFRGENLTALREIALRLTAEHVGQSLRGVMGGRQTGGPWRTNEKPLVAVGASPYSEHLIRWTRRVAAALDTPWVAAYVETSRPMGEEEQARLAKNLSLARQLGAEIVMTAGDDVVTALLQVAREQNVTQIIIGKTLQNPWLDLLKGGSLTNRLIRRSDAVDIYVIRAETSPRRKFQLETARVRTWLQELAIGTLAVAGVTLFCWFTQGFIGYWATALFYLSLVVILATLFHRLTILWVATLSALLWDFLFIPPRFTFRIGQFHDMLMFFMYYIIALVIGQLTSKLRMQELAERKREQRTRALYRMAQTAAESRSLEEGLKRSLHEISTLFSTQVSVLLANDDAKLDQPTVAHAWIMNEKEKSVAAWAFLNNQVAGRFTETLPDSLATYFPLRTAEAKTGILAVRFDEKKSLGPDERELLEAMAGQVATMVERYLFMQQATRTQLAEESERLHKIIFDSLSHELKTPLAVISAATETFRLNAAGLSPEQTGLTEEIQGAAVRLRRTIENLLGMSRIESGRLKLELNWCEVAELVQAAREQVADVLVQHKVRGSLGPELPLVKLDFGLMVHVLSNLLTNAALYSQPQTEISISAHMDGQELVLKISDQGPGLPAGSQTLLFNKFYRGPNAKPGGSGLGLAIVQALVRAHGGDVFAENNPGSGATFTIRLPVAVTPLGPESQLT
jgi:two-component system sensor histidine kinase KdpD